MTLEPNLFNKDEIKIKQKKKHEKHATQNNERQKKHV